MAEATGGTSEPETVQNADHDEQQEPEQMELNLGQIDREASAQFINRTALITYEIKPFKTTEYLPSLIHLALG